MSFILDALRKSEAARRRSEAPDLFAAMPAAAEPAKPRANWPLWLSICVAAASLIAALWLFAQRAPVASSAAPAASATAETPPALDTAAAAAVVAPTPAPQLQPTPAQPPAAPLPKPTVAAIPPPATPLSPPIRQLPTPPPEPIAVAPPPAAAPPAGDRIVTLADLDPATRKLLPPLKLSMHLWNETPTQRFVILDGQRLREGDVLGEIVVERITRDGATLVWRGGRLKIELR